MNAKIIPLLAVLMVLTIAGTAAPPPLGADDVMRMTKEILKDKLGAEDLVIVDVRLGKDWDASEFKIKGAVRGDPKDFDTWGAQYPQDKTLVLYCA